MASPLKNIYVLGDGFWMVNMSPREIDEKIQIQITDETKFNELLLRATLLIK